MKHKKSQRVVIFVVLLLLALFGILYADDDSKKSHGAKASEDQAAVGDSKSADDGTGYASTGSTVDDSKAANFYDPGKYNTFVGYYAGLFNSKGYHNTFLGGQAGYANTTGFRNTFVGVSAGIKNTEGMYNTFLGFGSGQYNTTGKQNTFLGYNAGYSNEASNNTFLGFKSGNFNTTGGSNTFVGYNAGYSNKTGNENTFLGLGAGYNSSGARNVFIGNKAGYNESGSDKLYIANGSADSNVLIYGDFSEGKVGIGKTDLSYSLDVNGTIQGQNIVNPSDVRLKKHIKPIKNALDNVTHLRGITFRWKDKKKDKKQLLGVIAQELETVFPEVVSTDNNGYKSVDYSSLVAPLIEAVKELKAENEALKERLEALEKK
jgi:hypothetical protein